MKRNCLFTLLLLSTFFAVAQPAYTLRENDNWKFYQYGGLHFVNNIPATDSSALQYSYDNPQGAVQTIGAAAVSDAAGNLLFYTDAYKVWNRNHQPMPNGNGLLTGNALDAVMITPVIDNPDQYYIFYMAGTMDFLGISTDAYQLRYTVVDMSLDNGMGDVVTTQKNVLVDQDLSGSMKIIPGDDCNLWLVTHDANNTEFKVFDINTTGVNTTSVNSNVGNGALGFMGPMSFGGNMAISHDRGKLAFAQFSGELIPILELFDFNTATGGISNATVIDTLSFIFGYSLVFSPDNSRLYLSMLNPGELSPDNPYNLHVESSLFQYNLDAGTAIAIDSSRVLLSDSISSYNNVMRMGPDGKIYMPASYGGDTSTSVGYFYGPGEAPGNYSGPAFQAYLGCIQDPDALGTACNLNRKMIALPAYSSGAESLGGEFVKPYPSDTVFARHDTVFCNPIAGQAILQSVYPAFYQQWDDGSTTAQRTITASGTYWVRNGDYCHYRVDSFVVIIDNINPVIIANGFVLSTTQPYNTYQWLYEGAIIAGATNNTYSVTENGNYAVIVSNAHCSDTSAIYTATGVTGIDDPYGLAQHIRVYPNPTTGIIHIDAPLAVQVEINSIEGKTIKTIKDTHVLSLETLSKGIYFLRISDKNGVLLHVEKIVRQ